MKKKYMYGLFALMALTFVSAGYLVNSLHLNVGVNESYAVEYT